MGEGIRTRRPATILMADDDPADTLLARKAMAQCNGAIDFRCVNDGETLLAYLHRSGPFAPPAEAPVPELILLDLNMPGLDGRGALRQIKTDPDLHRIPVIVMTTSQAEEDILRSYDLGANSFITKPLTYDRLLKVMGTISEYWFSVASPPRV